MSTEIERSSGSREDFGVHRFLHACFVRGSCDQIELLQIGVRGNTRVFAWTVAEEDEALRSPEHFTEQIVEMATDDAKMMRGPTQYLVAVTREGENSPFARRKFSIRSEASDDGSYAETEPADGVGITSMLMRHTEGMARTLIAGMGTAMMYTTNALKASEAKNARYEEKMFELIEMHENLSDRSAERELKKFEEKNAAELKNRLVGTLEPMLPMLLAKFMPSGSAAKAVGEKEGLKTFMANLREDQMMAIMNTLDEGQRMAMMTMIASMAEEEEAKAGKKGGGNEGGATP